MGDHLGACRSNYVLVNDDAAFCTWAALLGLEIMRNDLWSPPRVGIVCHDTLPSVRYDPITGDAHAVDIERELATHLQANQVAILVGVAVATAWPNRIDTISGWAVAINAAGETQEIVLSDIITLAEALLPAGVAAATLSTPEY